MSDLYKMCLKKATILCDKGLDPHQLGPNKMAKLMEQIEIEKKEKETKSDALIDYNDEIVSIENNGKLETIDIGVTGDNLFYCNNILTKNSFGLPATADFMFALITTEELEEHNQIKVKQLKNRYNDPIKNRTFVVGIDRAKMRLYDVEEEAQKELITEPKEKGIRTKSTMSWDRFKEEKKKSGLEKIVV